MNKKKLKPENNKTAEIDYNAKVNAYTQQRDEIWKAKDKLQEDNHKTDMGWLSCCKSFAWGMATAPFITLLSLPVAYIIFAVLGWLFSGMPPSAEEKLLFGKFIEYLFYILPLSAIPAIFYLIARRILSKRKQKRQSDFDRKYPLDSRLEWPEYPKYKPTIVGD